MSNPGRRKVILAVAAYVLFWPVLYGIAAWGQDPSTGAAPDWVEAVSKLGFIAVSFVVGAVICRWWAPLLAAIPALVGVLTYVDICSKIGGRGDNCLVLIGPAQSPILIWGLPGLIWLTAGALAAAGGRWVLRRRSAAPAET